MTKTNKLLIFICLLVLVCSMCLTFCACAESNQTNDSVATATKSPMVLAAVRRSVVRNGIEYPSIELTAYFEIAYDAGEVGLVEWSCSWVNGTPLASEPISDYVTVEANPFTAGNQRSATITCWKQFRDSYILVKATAGLSGYEAFCAVSYEGKPDSITVSGYTEFYPDDAGSTQQATISLDNVFHDVDSDFLSKVRVTEITWEGSYRGATRSINSTTGAITDTNVDYYDINSLKGKVTDYVSATVENGKLVFGMNQSLIGAYQRATTSSDKVTYSKYLIDNVYVFVNVTLQCENATVVYQFGIQGTVETLSLDDTEVSF